MKRVCTAAKSLIIIFLLFPICSRGTITLVAPFVDSFYCAGDTFSVGYNLSFNYGTSNTFSVVLSNGSGSFASNTTIIGAIADSVKGTILCTIPGNIAAGSAGNNYRIKIRSTVPLDSTAPNGYPITLIRVPVPVASVNPSNICVGDSIKLFGTDSLLVSYSWTGPGSFSSSSQNPVRTNAQLSFTGNYFVTASISSCSTSSFVVVAVKPLPTKPVASHLPAIPCTGDSLKLSSSTITGASYNWTGPIFTSFQQNPIIPNIDTTQKGNYIVTATLNGCSSKDTTAVTTIKLSPAKPTVSCDSPACAGSLFHLFANTITSGVTYSWVGPPAFIDTTNTPTIDSLSTANSGTFTVTVSKNGCNAKNSILVTVIPRPLISPITATGDCEGDTLKLHTSSTSSGAYSWTSNAGFSSITGVGDVARPNSDTTFNGTYYVVLADIAGCRSDTISKIITIKPKPAIPTVQTNSPICEGRSLVFTGASATSGVTYNWTGPAGASSANNQLLLNNVKKSASGKYTLTAGLAGCTSSSSVDAIVNPLISPDVTITADQGNLVKPNSTVMFTAHALNAGNNPTYQWRRNDVNIAGATSDVHIATIGKDLFDKDKLSVIVGSNEMCPFPDSVASYTFTVSVNDLSDVAVDNDVIIYPSPNYGKFIIKGTVNTKDAVEVRIIDIIGQPVFQDLVIPSNKHIILPVDITGVASGVYLLQLKAGDQLINKRFSIR